MLIIPSNPIAHQLFDRLGKPPVSIGSFNMKLCKDITEKDISIVEVGFSTDYYTSNMKSLKASFGDKIGTLGEFV